MSVFTPLRSPGLVSTSIIHSVRPAAVHLVSCVPIAAPWQYTHLPCGFVLLAYTTDEAAEGVARMLKGDWILYKTNDIS
jgi:hypothetical protein